MNYEKHLKDLRNKLAREQMSLLVGAGFSKNVHHLFLSWDELLFDLTNEIYGDEIKIAYQQRLKATPKSKITLTAFSKQKCKEITARIGYLEVVSEYIRRKGFPEAIATYIEDRTPSIEKNGTDFLLKVGSKPIIVKSEKLNLHRKIVELPWNNIYTTNYDDLLDICIDESQVAKLRSEIDELENATLNLNREREQLNKQKEELPVYDDTSNFSRAINPVDISLTGSDQKKNDIEKERKEIQIKINLNEAKINENDQSIKEKETALLNRYHVVRSAVDLRLKRTKNIIKLHGSLRSIDEKERYHFEFDNDPHKQYVIAKEHYESYPQKHEAFTQLMRIALLQESFCLIGFSRVDPNFKAWINWVKDILHREAIRNKKQQYKIFLIDAGSSEAEADQQLFYENHSIIRISLQSPLVAKFLEAECHKRVVIKDRTSALKAFLLFLANGDLINPEVSQTDLSSEKARMKIWREFSVYDIQNKPKHEVLIDTLQKLQNIKTKTWIGNLNYANTHNQHSLINYVNYQAYKVYILDDDKDNALKKLLLLALKEYYVPIYNFVDEDVVNALLASKETQSDTLLLIERANSLNVRKSDKQGFYEDLLQLAYSFQFKELRVKLNEWKPKGREHIQKAGFLSIFDSKESSRQLSLVIEDNYVLSDEELLYGYELLHFLQNTYSWPVDKKFGRAIRSYEKAGFQTLKDKFANILEQFQAKLIKPVPMGENRYSTSRSIIFRKHTQPEAALQYLMILAESGFQLMIGRTYHYAAEVWYNLMLSAFEYYPYAFLFYSLQYSDEKFLKRLGQQYAFSEGNEKKVRNALPEITKLLLNNFQDAPVDYQHHILVFLSKSIIAVDPDIWQDDFLKIWNLLLKQGVIFENPARYSFLNFFVNGLQYVTAPKIIQKIVADSLRNIETGNVDYVISYLYYLNKNAYYKTAKDNGIPPPLIRLINHTIGKLSQSDDNIIFIIGNLNAIMSDNQKSKIRNLMQKFDFTKVRNARAWRIFLYFIEGDKRLMEMFKAAVLESNGIWHTGVTDKTYKMGGTHLIELSKITKSEYLNYGIEFTQAELEELYHKLTAQLPGIHYFSSLDRESKFDFVDVLDEMQKFLISYESKLNHVAGFSETIEAVSNIFYVDRNYKALADGLISDDHSTVVWSLSELSPIVYKKLADPSLVKIIFYKVLLQHEPALEAAISYLSAWSKDLLNNPKFNDITTLYVEILKRFHANPLEDLDVAFVDLNLLVIAEQLNAIGFDDQIINWWIEKAKHSDYNNIKQHLLKGGKDED